MSIDAPETGLVSWIPRLVAALDDDPAGAGGRLRAIISGRSARIGLDDDVVLVESFADGALLVRPDDPSVEPDGSGFTSRAVVLALLDGEVEVNQIVINGLLELRSSIDDAMWMYRVIELLLDGASRVPQLRDLAAHFVEEFRSAARNLPVEDWSTGAGLAEIALLARLDLLEHRVTESAG